jgi:hypothetical protein
MVNQPPPNNFLFIALDIRGLADSVNCDQNAVNVYRGLVTVTGIHKYLTLTRANSL